MKRIAIILLKSLSKGEIGNISAILMGQSALIKPEVFANVELYDKDGQRHAAIRYSTVILKASGTGQLVNFANKIKNDHPEITSVLFTQTGQELHNAFDQYMELIQNGTTDELVPAGMSVIGEDEKIRKLTSKFSLFKD